jgi:hypothetical protein
MTFAQEGELCVQGTPVYRVTWFLVHTHTLLLASPTADAALRQCGGDAAWGSGDADLDFVLHDLSGGAGGDKREVVDYRFLAASPPPPRAAGQTPGERQAQLQAWMEMCFTQYNREHFADLLLEASPTLHFEYDSVLKNIGADGTGETRRTVHGLVLPAMDGSGGSIVHFTIPLLLKHARKPYEALSNVAVLYCKFAHHTWRPAYQVVAVEADLHVVIRVAPKKERLTVVSEEVVMRITDRAAGGATDDSLVPFLKSCLDLRGLPKLSLNPQGGGFIDFLPQLDDALYRRIREPLHFVKLVLGLTADFGNPVELSVSCKPLGAADYPQTSPMRKTAVFCVVDRASSIAFTVGLHYHSGSELPSIETTCTQYLNLHHEAPLSMKVKYPKSGAAMAKDDDGFVMVEDLRVAVVHGVMECMATSMAVA